MSDSEKIVERSYARRAQVLRMLGDTTRLKILDAIASRPIRVTSIVEAVGASQPSVSHHLHELTLCGIVESDRHGKEIHYGLTVEGARLAALAATID